MMTRDEGDWWKNDFFVFSFHKSTLQLSSTRHFHHLYISYFHYYYNYMYGEKIIMWSKKWEEIAATLQSVFSYTHNTNRLCCPFWKSLQKRIDKENLYGLISNHCSNSFSKIFIMKKCSKSHLIFFLHHSTV